MFKLFLASLAVLLAASTPGSCLAQESSELEIKYVFWSPPKYSTDGKKFESVMGVLSTNFKAEFLQEFDEHEEEYQLVKKARAKFNIGNWLMAAPAGILFGIAILTDSDAAPYIIAGSVLAIGDIVIGVSAYHNLSEAADMRNRRLMPTVSILY